MENVLFFPATLAPRHFATTLELIIKEIEAGNNVYFLYCKNDFKFCHIHLNKANNKSNKKKCKNCLKIRKKGLKLINSKKIKFIYLKDYLKQRTEYPLPSFVNDTKSFRKYKYGSFDVGYGVVASLAKEIDNSSFEEWRDVVSLFSSEAIHFHNCIKSIISDYNITLGYIFNPRYCLPKAFFRAFLDKKIDVYSYHWGSAIDKYEIFKNAYVDDINDYTQRVNAAWEKEPDVSLKKNIADGFFKSRFNGKITNDISYTKDQNSNLLPDELSLYKKIVVIFNSTECDFDNVGDQYTYKFYESQTDGICRIVKSLEKYPDIGIFLREHPNLKDFRNNQKAAVRKIHSNNFHLIPAESTVSSYSLLLKANAVITFNSGMGIEATYWGIPSILCSNAMYEKFNIAYQPSSHEEVINMILSDLKPIISDDVYKYGYYSSIYGIKYKYYEPIEFFTGRFMGVDLHYNFFRDKLKPFLKNKFPSLYGYLKKIFRRG